MKTPAWLDTTEYPFTSRFFDHEQVRQHYIDEGAGPVLLFVHGTPSWSFDFRQVIKNLARDFRCIAVDHVGFGLSDKPRHYDYSTTQHANRLAALIDYLNLRDFTMVVHDFGGPIGLSVALSQPARVHALIILNSWLWSSEAEPDFKKMRRILKSPLLPLLYRYLNFSARFVLPAAFGKKKPGKNIRRQYTAPFASVAEREGTIAFARSLVNDQSWFQNLWEQVSPVATKPTLFVWGMSDPVIKPNYLDRFRTGFPKSEVVTLPDSGHFPQEEEPLAVANGIRNFLYKYA